MPISHYECKCKKLTDTENEMKTHYQEQKAKGNAIDHIFYYKVYGPKIMVFTQQIKDIGEEDIIAVDLTGDCTFCNKKNVKIRLQIANPGIFTKDGFWQNACMDCSIKYYGDGDYESGHGLVHIPHDPLLDYLNEIDPIPGMDNHDRK